MFGLLGSTPRHRTTRQFYTKRFSTMSGNQQIIIPDGTIDGPQDPSFVSNVTPSSAEVAEQVFDIPELTEIVLSLLPPRDLFNTARAVQAFDHCLSSSRQVQTILCLRPEPNSFWNCILGEIPKIKYLMDCSIRSKWNKAVKEEIEVKVHMSEFWKHIDRSKNLPPSDSRVRSMLICQPPIKKMRALPECCGQFEFERYIGLMEHGIDYDLPAPPGAVRVHSTTGLIIGDLLNAEEEISSHHRLCPYATRTQHDTSTGEVEAGLEFTGKLILRSDDPELNRIKQVRKPFPFGRNLTAMDVEESGALQRRV